MSIVLIILGISLIALLVYMVKESSGTFESTQSAEILEKELLSLQSQYALLAYENLVLKSIVFQLKQSNMEQQLTPKKVDLVQDLTEKEIKILLMLVHPDKHKGSVASHNLFIKLETILK